MYFFSRSFCQCLLRSGKASGRRIFLKSSMHFFSSDSSILLSSSSSWSASTVRGVCGAPFSLALAAAVVVDAGGRGSVFSSRAVGRGFGGLSRGAGGGGGGGEGGGSGGDRGGPGT